MLDYPVTSNNKVDITNLTHATIDGNGVFDVLMRAVNAHLQKEWSANRLKGTEYSTVYLGALESTMNASLQFLLARDKTNAELDILKQQLDILKQQLVNLKVEEANAIKQGLQLVAQTAQTTQQTHNISLEANNIPKQGIVLERQATQIEAQTLNISAEMKLIEQKYVGRKQ